MKNTSILNRIIGLALTLALLVSMMPMLASEAYANSETVHIYKSDGNEATPGTDYTVDADVRYNLISDNLRVTTNGYVVKAAFALNNLVKNVTFENCRVFVDGGYMIQGDETQHNQTINIKGDCDFMCNIDSNAMLFDCSGGHKVTFTSSDKNNSLDIENYGQAIEVRDGSLNFTGEINATITGNVHSYFIGVQRDLYITDNAKLKVSCVDDRDDINDGIITGDDFIMDGNSKLDATARGTAITSYNGKLLVRENASLTASSYHYVVAKTNKEATFDTTGRVELTNHHSDGLLCEKLKVLNREGTVLIRGTKSTAIKLINEGDITLGKNIGMYASTNLDEPENSIMKEFTNITWKQEADSYYHPYFTDAAIKSILIKDPTKILKNTKTKISKLKSPSKKKVLVKFNKIPFAQKYEIRYKQSGQKWKTLTTKNLSKTFTKLKRNKKFYVKVRGTCTLNKVKFNSPWSNMKTIRVK